MTHVKIYLPTHATLAQFFDALDTERGQTLLQEFGTDFVSITDAMGHTTNTPHGALLHAQGVGTVLFENMHKVTLTGYLDDLAPYFGWNP